MKDDLRVVLVSEVETRASPCATRPYSLGGRKRLTLCSCQLTLVRYGISASNNQYMCREKPLSQKEPRTGLLSLLAVAGAIVGFAWWRRQQQQAKSQKSKGTQEKGSPFRFPNAKTGTSSRG